MDRDPVRKRVGDNLKAAREEVGITQEELATRSGLHLTAVGKHERGEREPLISTVIRLAKGLGVPADRLCEGIEWLQEPERFEIEDRKAAE
jgi:transcriptional regulator with XRE-family HTH domain